MGDDNLINFMVRLYRVDKQKSFSIINWQKGASTHDDNDYQLCVVGGGFTPCCSENTNYKADQLTLMTPSRSFFFVQLKINF